MWYLLPTNHLFLKRRPKRPLFVLPIPNPRSIRGDLRPLGPLTLREIRAYTRDNRAFPPSHQR
jgi:hypothetical protein